jgi:hypothetical protein
VCDLGADACALFDLIADPGELHTLGGTSPRAGRLVADIVRLIAPEAAGGTPLRRAVAMRETREQVLRSKERAAELLRSTSADERRVAARAAAMNSRGAENLELLRAIARADGDPEARARAAIAVAAVGDDNDKQLLSTVFASPRASSLHGSRSRDIARASTCPRSSCWERSTAVRARRCTRP